MDMDIKKKKGGVITIELNSNNNTLLVTVHTRILPSMSYAYGHAFVIYFDLRP